MATDRAVETLRGLLIPFPETVSPSSLWAAQSSYTEATPVVGLAEPQGAYTASLRTSGTQPAGSQLRVRFRRGGHPGPDGCAFVWQEEGDTDWYGWEPNVITAVGAVQWTDGTGAGTRSFTQLKALRTSTGRILVAGYRNTGGVLYSVAVYRSDDLDSWSQTTVYSETAAPTHGFHPVLVEMEDGGIHLFHIYEDSAVSEIQCMVWRSEDDGETFTKISVGALDVSIDISGTSGAGQNGYDIRDMHGARLDGQVVIFLELESHNTSLTYLNKVWQYASDSGGEILRRVAFTTSDFTSPVGIVGVAVHGGFIYMAHLASTAFVDVKIRRLGSAFEPFTSSSSFDIEWATSPNRGPWHGSEEFYTIASKLVTAGELHLVAADDGSLYLLARAVVSSVTGDEALIARSVDSGLTWQALGSSDSFVDAGTFAAAWVQTGSAGDHIKNMAPCWEVGRMLVFFNHDSGVSYTYDNSAMWAAIGGYSTMVWPALSGKALTTNRCGYSITYLPISAPDSQGWTATGAGTGSINSSEPAWNISTSANTLYYSLDPGGDENLGIIVEGCVTVNSGGSTSADDIALHVVLSDGSTEEVEVYVRISSSGFALYDPHAAANVGTGSIDFTAGVVFRLAIDFETGSNGDVAFWYRAKANTSDRTWTEGPTGNLTRNTTGVSPTSLVLFGSIGSSTADQDWHWVFFGADADAGQGVGGGQTNPDDLHPRDCGGIGWATEVEDGVRITGIDGPARVDQDFHIDADALYPVRRVFPGDASQGDPDSTWRSDADNQIERIAVAMDSTLLGTKESKPGNDTIALCLLNINFSEFNLQRYDVGSGSWVTIGSAIDTAIDMGTGTVSGATVRPTGGSVTGVYVHAGELIGYTVAMDSGSGITHRKITWNTSGSTDSSYGGKKCVIHFEGADGTESASSGLEVWPNNIAVSFNLLGETAAGYRLHISSQDTADGYYEIGTMLLGWVELFAQGPAYGWITELQSQTELHEVPGGGYRTRVAGRHRRRYDVAWTEPIYQTPVEGPDPDPDYTTASSSGGAEPVTTYGEIAYQLEGIARITDFGHIPVVFLRRLARGGAGGNSNTLQRRQEFIPGRLTSDIRVENVWGNEAEYATGEPGELVRVARVSFEEL